MVVHERPDEQQAVAVAQRQRNEHFQAHLHAWRTPLQGSPTGMQRVTGPLLQRMLMEALSARRCMPRSVLPC